MLKGILPAVLLYMHCMFLVYWCRTWLALIEKNKEASPFGQSAISVWKSFSRMQAWVHFFSLRQSDFLWLLKRISVLQTSLWWRVAQGLEAHLGPSCVRSPCLRPWACSPGCQPWHQPACYSGCAFYQLLGQWGLNNETGCVFFFLAWCVFQELFFCSRSLIDFPGLFFFSKKDLLWGEVLSFPRGCVY